MGKELNDNSILEMFGLSYDQSLLLFSAEKLIAHEDIKHTRNEKKAKVKSSWVEEWENGIITYLNNIDKDRCASLLSLEELQQRFKVELQNTNNKTWYYIIALELLEFVPYTSLGGEKDKEYLKCKFEEKNCNTFTKQLLLEHNCISKDKIERLDKVYSKSLSQISGKTGRVVTKVMIVIAVAALAAAGAALFAPGIAVALFGGAFEGLSGIALANACLALAGGGAVAAGGLGIAGGTAVIAGGGALLGLAGGGTVVGVASALMLSSPEYTLTQAAKLETILKEVIINAQQDVVCAQKIISEYKAQISELNKKLIEMELDNEKNKNEIKNIKACIKYLTKSCKDMSVFASAYGEGLKTEA